MDHPICEQGGSDAHLLLNAACKQLGRVQRTTGLRWSRSTLSSIQVTLGWKRWQRVTSAVQDLEDDSAGAILIEGGVVAVPPGMECQCMFDTASSGGTRARTRPHAKTPSPSSSSPSSLPSAAESGSSSFGSAASRRMEDRSGGEFDDEAPHVVAGHRIGRRKRIRTAEEQAKADQQEREKRLKRLRTPVEDWTAAMLAEEFIDLAKRKLNSFSHHRNPAKPLAKFYAEARLAGVDNATLLRVTEKYLSAYRLDSPPWRPFISAAPEMISKTSRHRQMYGEGRGRIDIEEVKARYGARRSDPPENPDA